mmetsp:Transcript_16217/g.47617  ORF Transcript_16217/g.47617 Transcript_16217/m.47617 type:complete len:227 (-) Transcript_16217:471-1151(-)
MESNSEAEVSWVPGAGGRRSPSCSIDTGSVGGTTSAHQTRGNRAANQPSSHGRRQERGWKRGGGAAGFGSLTRIATGISSLCVLLLLSGRHCAQLAGSRGPISAFSPTLPLLALLAWRRSHKTRNASTAATATSLLLSRSIFLVIFLVIFVVTLPRLTPCILFFCLALEGPELVSQLSQPLLLRIQHKNKLLVESLLLLLLGIDHLVHSLLHALCLSLQLLHLLLP